jgi:hypothetical protein
MIHSTKKMFFFTDIYPHIYDSFMIPLHRPNFINKTEKTFFPTAVFAWFSRRHDAKADWPASKESSKFVSVFCLRVPRLQTTTGEGLSLPPFRYSLRPPVPPYPKGFLTKKEVHGRKQASYIHPKPSTRQTKFPTGILQQKKWVYGETWLPP